MLLLGLSLVMRLSYLISLAAAWGLCGCIQGQNEQPLKNGKEGVGDAFIGMLKGSKPWDKKLEAKLADQWGTSSVPFVLELSRFTERPLRKRLYGLISEKTGQSFGTDGRKWQNWLWQQDYKALENYPEFKSQLYRKIDPKFADYFKNDLPSTIRLDEVVWGGVIQDGIPPLRNPEMISVKKATYLADSNIIFGIDVNGEARAYPKRILAWHEMFTDTIQGIPLAGVY